MKIFGKADLEKYLEDDWIADELEKSLVGGEESIRTNIWLKEMDNKRMIYAAVYGDILHGSKTGRRILDVGGGYNSLTKKLADNSEYYLLDYMAHGGQASINEFSRQYHIHWIDEDWYEYSADQKFDIVIANDIFPDVDQRMELFIDKYLPLCKELRIVVTYYNSPKFYITQRMDDAEKLTFLSWDGEITALKLKKYLGKMLDTSEKELNAMKDSRESIYRNGRHIAYLTINGLCGQ